MPARSATRSCVRFCWARAARIWSAICWRRARTRAGGSGSWCTCPRSVLHDHLSLELTPYCLIKETPGNRQGPPTRAPWRTRLRQIAPYGVRTRSRRPAPRPDGCGAVYVGQQKAPADSHGGGLAPVRPASPPTQHRIRKARLRRARGDASAPSTPQTLRAEGTESIPRTGDEHLASGGDVAPMWPRSWKRPPNPGGLGGRYRLSPATIHGGRGRFRTADICFVRAALYP